MFLRTTGNQVLVSFSYYLHTFPFTSLFPQVLHFHKKNHRQRWYEYQKSYLQCCCFYFPVSLFGIIITCCLNCIHPPQRPLCFCYVVISHNKTSVPVSGGPVFLYKQKRYAAVVWERKVPLHHHHHPKMIAIVSYKRKTAEQ